MCIVNRDEYKHLLYENRANKKKSLQFALGIPHNFYALLKKNIDEQRKGLKFFGQYYLLLANLYVTLFCVATVGLVSLRDVLDETSTIGTYPAPYP